MSPGKNVILTGFMGSGKSTVGKLLADALQYQFVDTDALIEAHYKKTIPEIFSDWGEDVFRQIEAELAQTLAGKTRTVIATGGRFMLDPANAAVFRANSLVFCLTAPAEEILKRLKGDINQRPLLAGPNPDQKIVQLLADRAEAYGRFPQINTQNQTPADIVQQIMALIKERC